MKGVPTLLIAPLWQCYGPNNSNIYTSKRGYFRHPTLDHFFPPDTDIQPKISVARYRHSDLLALHLTLHFSPSYHWPPRSDLGEGQQCRLLQPDTVVTVFSGSRRRSTPVIMQKLISNRRPTLRPSFMGPSKDQCVLPTGFCRYMEGPLA